MLPIRWQDKLAWRHHHRSQPVSRHALSVVLLIALASPPLVASQQQSAAADHAARMHALHLNDSPVPSGAVPRDLRAGVDTQTVTYATVGGKPVRGFLAHPAGAKKGTPGIVVVHEWWGLNDNVRAAASRLAGEGYVALAVDLMGGGVAPTPDSARKLMQYAMDNAPQSMENLSAAINYLRERGATKIGTIGWCFGGHWSLRAGLVGGDRVNAVVMYYGRPITDATTLTSLKAPLLGLFGSQDEGIPQDSVRAMAATLEKLGKPATVEFFDAGHGFANPSGRAYNAAAAEAAWSRTIAFFRRQL